MIFFSLTYDTGLFSIDNFIFGSKPHHVIFKGLINKINSYFTNPSKKIKTLYVEDIQSFTDQYTACPFGFSYFEHANKDRNIDVVYPKVKEDSLDEGVKEDYTYRLLKKFCSKNKSISVFLILQQTKYN